MPDLQWWTWTLERVVDPGIGVVQEWIDPRLLGLADPRPVRRERDDPPSFTRERGEERERLWIRPIVTLDEHILHAEPPQRLEPSSAAERRGVHIDLVGIEASAPQIDQSVGWRRIGVERELQLELRRGGLGAPEISR